MEEVWLVWKTHHHLSGVYADEKDAEQFAENLRSRLAADRFADFGKNVRVDPWVVIGASSAAPRPRVRVRTLITQMSKDWPLLTVPDLGTGHHFMLDKYLAVPHRGILKFPEFQFQTDRTLWPGFREVLAILRSADWDDPTIALWFTNLHALEGECPALLLRIEPEAVIAGARRMVRRR